MATTIQVQESTKQMLEWLKESENKSTFDEVIRVLANSRLEVPASLFGKGKGKVSRFTRSDRMGLHEL